MTWKTLALALLAAATTGVASAQQIQPDGHYAPAAPSGTGIQPATYTVPQTMPQTVTYSQPGVMTSGMTSGTTQFFPGTMPGATVLNGTTTAVRNVSTTVVSGTRRTVRRGLGIFRR